MNSINLFFEIWSDVQELCIILKHQPIPSILSCSVLCASFEQRFYSMFIWKGYDKKVMCQYLELSMGYWGIVPSNLILCIRYLFQV